ncbi:hypothetical protein AURANDRAFT_68117 [Aureococcus anophagefferens]|uniref:tRNA(Ile)-lysidine synthetase n=1 Tax=Aureococcus anophagefferens TaxID=44056 RepID=F0YNJ2_AURAN|nr:hypothetical protein AURANDRAFT_68117 [Aureococcus anophagefferens]EGB03318.1 hypothetical protein AURANDRAFT_68117 [Aureococcus anophagefferens]|eukprot:XP_009041998.1 hypothetical protein AURANDRAFT_68117 [Aureococcus anophagefferens]
MSSRPTSTRRRAGARGARTLSRRLANRVPGTTRPGRRLSAGVVAVANDRFHELPVGALDDDLVLAEAFERCERKRVLAVRLAVLVLPVLGPVQKREPELQRIVASISAGTFIFCTTVSVLNFDHRQRGEISSCDTLFVAALARRFGLECTAHNWVHSSTHSSQMEFRAWRRTTSFKTAFNVVDALIPQRCGHVALAHHADDQMESFLLRLARGSRLTNVFKGVASQAAPCFVRPLLFATKHDLVTYLDADGESWREDTTNTDTTHYVRNLSRLTVLPPLRTLCGGSLQLHTRLKALQYQAQFFEAWVSHAADEWLSYSTRADGAVSLVTYADTPAPVLNRLAAIASKGKIADNTEPFAIPFKLLLDTDMKLLDRTKKSLAHLRIIESSKGIDVRPFPNDAMLRVGKDGDTFHAPWRDRPTPLVKFLRGQKVFLQDCDIVPLLATDLGMVVAVFLPDRTFVASPFAFKQHADEPIASRRILVAPRVDAVSQHD